MKDKENPKLTPESEECYSRVPASFPSDWWGEATEEQIEEDRGLQLKPEAPQRAHEELKKWYQEKEEAFKQGIILN